MSVLQGLQSKYARQGVTWLLVNSTNRSHQDYLEPDKLSERFTQLKGRASALLMDADGEAGLLRRISLFRFSCVNGLASPIDDII